MRPKVLILDEPTAGMDRGAGRMFSGRFRRSMMSTGTRLSSSPTAWRMLRDSQTGLWSSEDGRIVMDGPPRNVFERRDELVEIGLGVPQVTDLMAELARRGYGFPTDVITVGEASEALLPSLLAASGLARESDTPCGGVGR